MVRKSGSGGYGSVLLAVKERGAGLDSVGAKEESGGSLKERECWR
jgi:hypothetical protein